jgi:hypothetical protein
MPVSPSVSTSDVTVSEYKLGWRGTGLILLFGITMLIGYHLSGRALTMHERCLPQVIGWCLGWRGWCSLTSLCSPCGR